MITILILFSCELVGIRSELVRQKSFRTGQFVQLTLKIKFSFLYVLIESIYKISFCLIKSSYTERRQVKKSFLK